MICRTILSYSHCTNSNYETESSIVLKMAVNKDMDCLAGPIGPDFCIANLKTKFLFGQPKNSQTLIGQLSQASEQRKFQMKQNNNFVSAQSPIDMLTPLNHINKGKVIGVIRGTLVEKTPTEVAAMPWPVMQLNYKGQPFPLPHGVSDSSLSLMLSAQPKRGAAPSNKRYIIDLPKDKNPLRHCKLTIDPIVKHNAVGQFVEWNGEAYFIIEALKTIYAYEEIVVHANDVSLYETYGEWLARRNQTSPSSSSSNKENISPKKQPSPTKKKTTRIPRQPSPPPSPYWSENWTPNSSPIDSPTYSPARSPGGSAILAPVALDPFELGKQINMKHVGMLFHYANQTNFGIKNQTHLKWIQSAGKEVIEQEASRRDPAKEQKRTKKYVGGWDKLFRRLFKCEKVKTSFEAKYEEIKKQIEEFKKEYEKQVNNDTGVLMFLVFSAQLLDNLGMFVGGNKAPSTHLFDLILNPLFEVKEDGDTQRFFPVAIIESSTGRQVFVQERNASGTFEYVRWGPAAPNIPVLDTGITFSLRYLNRSFEDTYSNPNIAYTDLLQTLQKAHGLEYKDFYCAYYPYEKQKPSFEHSTTEKIILDRPPPIPTPLPQNMIKGKYIVIRHITEKDNQKSIDLINHEIVATMRYLNAEQGCDPIDFNDFLEKDIQDNLKKETEKYNKRMVQKKQDILTKINEIPGAHLTETEIQGVLNEIPETQPPTFASIKWAGKYDLTTARKKKCMEAIEKVAKECKEKGLFLVLVFYAHGLHSLIRIGDVPRRDEKLNIYPENYYLQYSDIYHRVRELGVKKLIVFSGHCQGESDGDLKNQYKFKYPKMIKGGREMYEEIIFRDVRGEISVPQVGAVWTTAPSTQLPKGQTDEEFTPTIRQLEQVESTWPKGVKKSMHTIVQRWNQIANNDLLSLDTVTATPELLEKDNIDKLATKTQIRYLNSFVFDYEW